MEKRSTKSILSFIYVLAVGYMFYYNDRYINLIVINLMHKYLISALIPIVAFFLFLKFTDLKRAKVILKYVLIFSLPCIVELLWTIPLWLLNSTRFFVIRRGMMAEMYTICMVMTMGSLVYFFGEGAIWRAILAAIIANSLKMLDIFYVGGSIPEYIDQFILTVSSFAAETGPLMETTEIHELTFAIGVFITYLALTFSEYKRKWYYHASLFTLIFFYFTGFKRIGMIATAVSIAVGAAALFIYGNRDRWRRSLVFFSFLAVGICYLYLAMVRAGFMTDLSNEYDVNVMGRSYFYEALSQYYVLNPLFSGNGAGFTSRFLTDNAYLGIVALHNDILKVYIDIGFWGFLAWAIAYFPVRIHYIAKWQGIRGGIICLACTGYLFMTAATDNTLYYTYVTGAAALVSMVYHFKEVVEKEKDIPTVDSDR